MALSLGRTVRAVRTVLKHARRLHVSIIGAQDVPTDLKTRMQALSPLSVTTFSTQYNESEQMAINILNALPKPEPNERMQQGTIEHDRLERLSLVTAVDHSIFDLMNDPAVQSQKDIIKMLDMANKINSLCKGVGVRELSVRGIIDGYALSGKIDGIELCDGDLMIVENKTSVNPVVSDYKLRLAYHQVLFYHKLLTQLMAVDSRQQLAQTMVLSNDLDDKLLPQFADVPISQSFKTGGDVLDLLLESLRNLRGTHKRLLPSMELRFLTAASFKPVLQTYKVEYDAASLAQIVQFRTDLFEGRRLPAGGTLKDALSS